MKVPGGIIDSDDSGPTGILREAAGEIMVQVMGQKTIEEKKRFIREGLEQCLRYGLTSVHTNDESSVHAYKYLLCENKLPIRVFLTPVYTDIYKAEADGGLNGMGSLSLAHEINPGNSNTVNSRLVINRVKIFSDGSLGAETAAIRTSLARPSDDSQGTNSFRGVLIHEDGELRDMIRQCKDLGYRVEVHAIGDAAAEQV